MLKLISKEKGKKRVEGDRTQTRWERTSVRVCVCVSVCERERERIAAKYRVRNGTDGVLGDGDFLFRISMWPPFMKTFLPVAFKNKLASVSSAGVAAVIDVVGVVGVVGAVFS